MKKIRTGYIEKRNGIHTVYYRVNGVNRYKKEFLERKKAIDFLWQKKGE